MVSRQPTNDGVELAKSPSITTRCILVPVSNGHLADVSVKFDRLITKNELLAALDAFAKPLNDLQLASIPAKLIQYREKNDRPQARLDRDYENSMRVTIGRLCELPKENLYD